jgi:hypothetical protein
MVVRQDIRTTYDLGGNATQVKFCDDLGLAYTETRTYARGYQLTGASFSDVRADVTVTTNGSYTYDTNNNMTGTMKADAHITASGNQLSYRAAWTFTFDRKNRLTSFNYGTGTMNVWYDGVGRIWQRWQKIGLNWQGTLSRNVYDGSSLVQEHTFSVANQGGSWVYTYSDISRDYLRHPGGMRERQGTATSYDDYFQQGDSGRVDYRYKRNSAIDSVARVDRTRNMNQLSGGTFTDVSHLATSGAYIESYGGGTAGNSAGFDPLLTGGGGKQSLLGLRRKMGNGRESDELHFFPSYQPGQQDFQFEPVGNWIPPGAAWSNDIDPDNWESGHTPNTSLQCMILRKCHPLIIMIDPADWPCYTSSDRCSYFRANVYLHHLGDKQSTHECWFTSICMENCAPGKVPPEYAQQGWEFHECINNLECFYRRALAYGGGSFQYYDALLQTWPTIDDCHNYYDSSFDPVQGGGTPLGWQGQGFNEALYGALDRCRCFADTVGIYYNWRINLLIGGALLFGGFTGVLIGGYIGGMFGEPGSDGGSLGNLGLPG